jgi:hypothetical protein
MDLTREHRELAGQTQAVVVVVLLVMAVMAVLES